MAGDNRKLEGEEEGRGWGVGRRVGGDRKSIGKIVREMYNRPECRDDRGLNEESTYEGEKITKVGSLYMAASLRSEGRDARVCVIKSTVMLLIHTSISLELAWCNVSRMTHVIDLPLSQPCRVMTFWI